MLMTREDIKHKYECSSRSLRVTIDVPSSKLLISIRDLTVNNKIKNYHVLNYKEHIFYGLTEYKLLFGDKRCSVLLLVDSEDEAEWLKRSDGRSCYDKMRKAGMIILYNNNNRVLRNQLNEYKLI
jgi:hypothetical protein